MVRSCIGAGVASGRLMGRGFSTEVSTTVNAAKPVKRGGGIGQRLGWFSFGTAASLVFGYYQLTHDIEQCTNNVELALQDMRRDTLAKQNLLLKRINELEGKR